MIMIVPSIFLWHIEQYRYFTIGDGRHEDDDDSGRYRTDFVDDDGDVDIIAAEVLVLVDIVDGCWYTGSTYTTQYHKKVVVLIKTTSIAVHIILLLRNLMLMIMLIVLIKIYSNTDIICTNDIGNCNLTTMINDDKWC